MPLTLTLTQGLIDKPRLPETMSRLSQAFLDLHGLTGNTVLTPNVIGHVNELPEGSTFAGLTPTPVAIVEWLTPSFAFVDADIQRAYIQQATDIVAEACEGRLAHDKIWVNVKHAVDGTWGIAGQAMSNEALIEAIGRG